MSPIVRRNAVLNGIGEGLWGLGANMILPSTVLVVALKELGAGKTMLGSISAIESASFLLPQFAGLYLFRSRHNLKWRLIWWHFLPMIPTLPIMGALLWFGPQWGWSNTAVRIVLLTLFAWYIMSIGAILGVWFDWIAHLFDKSVRGTVMGASFCLASAMGSLGALAAAQIIATMGPPKAFAILYFCATITASLSLVAFMFVHDPPDTGAPPATPTIRELLAKIRHSYTHHNFRLYLSARAMAVLGFCITLLITSYYTSEAGGNVPGATVVAAGSMMTIMQALMNLIAGRLGDTRGHRLGQLMAVTAQTVALSLPLFTSGTISCFATFGLIGLANGAAFMSHQNMLFETCPHDHRLAHITAGSLAIAPIAIGGPLIWGTVARYSGMTPVFLGCLVASSVALLMLFRFVRDPRHVSQSR